MIDWMPSLVSIRDNCLCLLQVVKVNQYIVSRKAGQNLTQNSCYSSAPSFAALCASQVTTASVLLGSGRFIPQGKERGPTTNFLLWASLTRFSPSVVIMIIDHCSVLQERPRRVQSELKDWYEGCILYNRTCQEVHVGQPVRRLSPQQFSDSEAPCSIMASLGVGTHWTVQVSTQSIKKSSLGLVLHSLIQQTTL